MKRQLRAQECFPVDIHAKLVFIMAQDLLKESNIFTALDALKLVSSYFDFEWPTTELEDVQLRKVTGGFVNRLHLITRTNSVDLEPATVLIRHFGLGSNSFHEVPLASSTTLSATEQALVYYEMGRRGWGPKVYGIFPGGRLEEYIDAHPLTADEACEPAISKDLASSYARLHSLQLPFRKRNFSLIANELKQALLKRQGSVVKKLEESGNADSIRLASVLQDTAWHVEIDWVSSLFDKHQCKTAIAVGDSNFLNVLVKNCESGCRTVLIDYETCTYSYRGIDVGGHFNERMYCWAKPESNLTGHDAPDMEEQRMFCRSYLAEARSLGQRIGPNDTEEHLMLEASIGRMWQLMFSVFMGFVAGDLPDDPVLHAGLAHMLETYGTLKRKWNA